MLPKLQQRQDQACDGQFEQAFTNEVAYEPLTRMEFRIAAMGPAQEWADVLIQPAASPVSLRRDPVILNLTLGETGTGVLTLVGNSGDTWSVDQSTDGIHWASWTNGITIGKNGKAALPIETSALVKLYRAHD